jgi:hypothetical protein
MFGKKKNKEDLQKKYNIPTTLSGTSTIQELEVIRQNEPNKRVTVIRDADGEVMMVSERDLFLDIF